MSGKTKPNLAPTAFRLDNGTNMALPSSTNSEVGLPAATSLQTEVLLGMRGWLMKRKKGVFDRTKNKGKFMSLLGDFNKRFFWLDPSIRLIYYSESEDKSKRVSFIPFNRIVSVTAVTDPQAINSAKAGWVYGLELETLDRVYELWARSSADMKQWLAVLEKAASIGRAGGSSIGSHFSVNSSIGSARGSEQNTVPVVNAPKPVNSPMSDNVTVDIATAPPARIGPISKWDDWDK